MKFIPLLSFCPHPQGEDLTWGAVLENICIFQFRSFYSILELTLRSKMPMIILPDDLSLFHPLCWTFQNCLQLTNQSAFSVHLQTSCMSVAPGPRSAILAGRSFRLSSGCKNKQRDSLQLKSTCHKHLLHILLASSSRHSQAPNTNVPSP